MILSPTQYWKNKNEDINEKVNSLAVMQPLTFVK